MAVDYVLIDASRNRNLRISDFLFEGLKLIDIFQQLETKYMFIRIPYQLLPLVFNVYQESSYEFKLIVPWVKSNFDDNSLIDILSKYKNCVDYILVFQKSEAVNIKQIFKTLFIEPQEVMSLNSWEKTMMRDMKNLGYEGVYITSDGIVTQVDSNQINMNAQSKIELF